MGASASLDLSQSGKDVNKKFPAPVKDGDAIVFAVHPMTYETWAFEGLDANGLVGLHVSEFGFRIVTTQVPRKTLKSFPMASVQSWTGSKKIFKFAFTEAARGASGVGGGEKVQSCQLCTTWVPRIMEAIDNIVQRVLTKRQSRQMSAAEFAEFIRELEAVPINDERRGSLVFQFAQDNWVTPQQGVEALRRLPKENGFDRIKAVVAMHRRMSNADGFKLIIDELRPLERANAWELIAKGTHEIGPTS